MAKWIIIGAYPTKKEAEDIKQYEIKRKNRARIRDAFYHGSYGSSKEKILGGSRYYDASHRYIVEIVASKKTTRATRFLK